MGLLEKTLKKAGIERKKSAPAPAPATPDEKPAVKWIDTPFRERTSALADKIDLESQYARLEAMTQSAAVPPPPKSSLRDRARRLLSGLTGSSAPSTPAFPPTASAQAERPRMSLRQRAQMLMKKLTGSGSGGDTGGTAGGAPTTAGQSAGDDQHLASADYPLEQFFFPWHALSEEGALQSHVTFGEEHHVAEAAAAAVAEPVTAPVQETPPAAEPKSTLSEFADTIGRITENLKNLHVQLDQGNFIREAREAPAPAETRSAATPLISHHVPVEGGAESAVIDSTGTVLTPQADTATAIPAQEKARDIFWPKQLPLDLPARDIKLNADGTVSVVPGPFQLPYLAEDIAPPESDLSHFTRNLQNAELFIAEGELQLTRIIYERLLIKISDEEARRKIRANLDALNDYRKSHDWGNFMPVPPWNQRNPYQDFKPPQLSISEMPVEAKNITINLDKGFFEIAKAIFEQQKELVKTLGKGKGDEEEAAAEGKLPTEEEAEAAEAAAEEEGAEAEGAGEAEAAAEDQQEKRTGEDRRKGGPDTRGEGAEERRSGRDRREEAQENAPPAADEAQPAPLAADGASAAPQPEELPDGVMEQPQIPDMSPDGQAMAGAGAGGEEGDGKEKEEENKVQEIRGVLELKTPDQEDTPFLTLTYDFTKIPHAYRLAKDNGIFEYAYYKYKPMLVKAHQFIKRKQITRALNYYRVIREQQIPTEFRHMVDRNIKDITEYLQKYLVTRQN